MPKQKECLAYLGELQTGLSETLEVRRQPLFSSYFTFSYVFLKTACSRADKLADVG